MVINKLLKVWFNGFWECPFIQAKIHGLETLQIDESVRCPEFRGGRFSEVAYMYVFIKYRILNLCLKFCSLLEVWPLLCTCT